MRVDARESEEKRASAQDRQALLYFHRALIIPFQNKETAMIRHRYQQPCLLAQHYHI